MSVPTSRAVHPAEKKLRSQTRRDGHRIVDGWCMTGEIALAFTLGHPVCANGRGPARATARFKEPQPYCNSDGRKPRRPLPGRHLGRSPGCLISIQRMSPQITGLPDWCAGQG